LWRGLNPRYKTVLPTSLKTYHRSFYPYTGGRIFIESDGKLHPLVGGVFHFKFHNSKIAPMIKSLLYFLSAGLFEIGGGYLIWLWLREGKSIWWGIWGGIALTIYGIIATLQPANFGRVYAAYGGVFMIMAMLWGWKVDGVAPDRYDLIGACFSLLSVLFIMYARRI
jgi:small multidrug resistance family-3 protein